MSDLSEDDVLSMSHPNFGTASTFKVSELKSKVRQFANQENKGSAYLNAKVQWFSDAGVECELLRVQSSGWQKGRLRFKLEFIPDPPAASPDSNFPLDDLRSTLK